VAALGGKRTLALYGQAVKQDPEYLRNQSRYLHRMYRRNWRFTRWFLLLWSLLCFGSFVVALADVTGNIGWGFTKTDIRKSLLFLAFGAGVWLFVKVIHSFLLAYVRHTYGPDPGD
jgi:hypothetical protein